MGGQTVFNVRKEKNDLMCVRKMTKQQQRQEHYCKHLQGKSKGWTVLNGKAVGLSLGTNVPYGNPDSALVFPTATQCGR
jgi:hypothetical protein